MWLQSATHMKVFVKRSILFALQATWQAVNPRKSFTISPRGSVWHSSTMNIPVDYVSLWGKHEQLLNPTAVFRVVPLKYIIIIMSFHQSLSSFISHIACIKGDIK